MSVEHSFLHSKLARRIFWLFVLCALLPISLLALVSLRNVSAQLNEQNRLHLRQFAREEAMGICQRLLFLEADVTLLGSNVARNSKGSSAAFSLDPNTLPPNLVRQLKGVELVTPDGKHQLLFGKTPQRIVFTEEEEKFLNSGKNVLSIVPCQGMATCILLSRSIKAGDWEQGTLVAEIEASYLWDVEDLPKDTNLCVLDAQGRNLFCSAETPTSFPEQVAKSFSGEFEWKADRREFLAQYWNLPLAVAFFTPHWTVVGSEAKLDALAPLTRFRTSFLLVFLLAVWIVLLLSLVQIRRNLVPLAKLKEATRRISQGNFRERVSVQSGDEFEELAGSFNFMAGRIEKQLNSLKAFNEIDRAILSAWDIDKIVDTLSTRLTELMPLDLLAVTLFDAEESSSVRSHVYDRSGSAKGIKENIQPNAEDLRLLGEQPEIVTVGATEQLPGFLKPLATRGMKYLLKVPIFLEGRPTAVICLGHATACVWNEEDVENARQLADQVGVALSNSLLVRRLHTLHWGAFSALARAIDAKSPWTLGHSERVTNCAIKIADAMGLPAKELEIIRRGGLLHDIGKIGVPAEVLDKPGKLTDQELILMREHVNIGVRILQPIPGFAESMPIISQHHEWMNGEGYPNGLKGDEISLHARIFAVADCYDALISDRPYRPGMPIEKVIEIISAGVGKQFDLRVVEVFRRVMEQENVLREIAETMRPMVEVL